MNAITQTSAIDHGNTSEASQVSVAPLASVELPLPQLFAALACSSTEETRYYLNGVFLHSVEGAVRIVSTDGHRLFVASHRDQKQELPSWLEKGIIIPNTMLKPRLALISKAVDHFQFARVSYAVDAAKLELSDVTGENVFRLSPVDGTFPDYQHIIGSSLGAFSADKPAGDFERIGFSAGYLKQVGEISKALDSQFVSVYGKSQTEPSVFTFDNCPGAVLYLMPANAAKNTIHAETAQILNPAIKGTLAALKAHQTRNEESAAAAKTKAGRDSYLAKAAGFKARIDAILGKVEAPALPAPAPETPAESAAPSEASDKPAETSEAPADTSAPSYAISAAVSEEPAQVEQPAPASEPEPVVVPFKAKGKRPTASAAQPEAKPTRGKRDFTSWQVAVSAEIKRLHGVELDDLPDAPTRDWFDAKISVAKAAERAIAWAKTF